MSGVTAFSITPQNNRYVTLKVIDFANVHENHTLTLPVNPSTKTFQHDIRTTLTQTEGGAWIDDFGMGVPILTLTGNTGWRPLHGRYNGRVVDGFQAYLHLYQDIIQHFFAARALAKTNPDSVEMVMIDDVDRVTYRIVPTQQFSDTRSNTTPLLFPYSATFIVTHSSLSSQALKPLVDPGFISNPKDRPAAVKTLNEKVKARVKAALQPKQRTYTVQSGDTLSGIAQLYYGNGSLWGIIAKANHIANPDLIGIGKVLVIPYR